MVPFTFCFDNKKAGYLPAAAWMITIYFSKRIKATFYS